MNRKLEILLAEFKDNLKTNYDLKKKKLVQYRWQSQDLL